MNAHRNLTILTVVLGAMIIWSGIGPKDRATWWLEVAPAIAVIPLLWFTLKRFPLTPMLYTLIGVHGAVLCLGGHYTYAEVPLGYWLQDVMGASRNHYDRIGHVVQGFVPAIAVREVLLRTSPLQRGGWLSFLVVCTCLAISAFYEMIEWWVALLSEQAAEAFLGTQGDNWDTQWDMFLALCGAIVSVLLLSRWHDRQLAQIPGASDG